MKAGEDDFRIVLCDGPKRESTWATERSRLNRHVRPLLGNRPANKIQPDDVEGMQADVAAGKTAVVEKTKNRRGKAIVEGGRIAAANAVVCLSSMYSWAVWKKLLKNEPLRRRSEIQPTQAGSVLLCDRDRRAPFCNGHAGSRATNETRAWRRHPAAYADRCA